MTRDTAQFLRAYTALTEAPVQIPAPILGASQTPVTSAPRYLTLPLASGAPNRCRRTDRQTY